MKKIYISPEAQVITGDMKNLMYTTSIDNGGNGDDSPVDAKRGAWTEWDDDDDEEEMNEGNKSTLW